MTTKNYEKSCARLVQEAAKVSYTMALRWTKEHQMSFPETMPVEARALKIFEDRHLARKT